MVGAVGVDEVDARILVGVGALGGRLGQDLLERVVHAVLGREDQDVRDVVEEARAAAGVPEVRVPHAPREQVEAAVVEDRAGVEDRAVPRHGTARDDWAVAHAADVDDRQGLLRVTGHRNGGG